MLPERENDRVLEGTDPTEGDNERASLVMLLVLDNWDGRSNLRVVLSVS